MSIPCSRSGAELCFATVRRTLDTVALYNSGGFAMHRHTPRLFEGRSSRFYDLVARRLLRPVYRRLAADIAGTAPSGAAVLDVGTGPGVLLVELARRRPDLSLTGIDLSADMVGAATRNLRPFGDRATARVAD